MKKNINLFTKIALIASLIVTISSCSNGGPIEVEEYIGEDIKISGTCDTCDYSFEYTDIKLDYIKDPAGDWFELYYTSTETETDKTTKITETEIAPESYKFQTYKDGKDVFFIWAVYEKTEEGIDECIGKIPVKMEKNTISFTLTYDNFIVGKRGKVEELNFVFTKVK